MLFFPQYETQTSIACEQCLKWSLGVINQWWISLPQFPNTKNQLPVLVGVNFVGGKLPPENDQLISSDLQVISKESLLDDSSFREIIIQDSL